MTSYIPAPYLSKGREEVWPLTHRPFGMYICGGASASAPLVAIPGGHFYDYGGAIVDTQNTLSRDFTAKR